MSSSHCTILARFFTRRQIPEIVGKSVLVHASDNHAVWIMEDAIWENVGDSQSCGVNEFWLKNTSAMIYSQWESKIQASGKFGEDFFFVPFLLSNYLCTNNVAISVNFCIRIYRTGTRRYLLRYISYICLIIYIFTHTQTYIKYKNKIKHKRGLGFFL